MDRRTYLGSAGVAGLTSVAGCLGGALKSIRGDDDTVLGPPETDLSEATHPSYGDEYPAVSVPDPLSGETISTDQFEGDRTVLMTFLYTNCPDGMCPALTLRLRRAQEVAAENGYGDEAAFLAMTFDPERDTAETLRTFGEERGVDLDAGNWHFLRPERYEDAQSIISDTYGLPEGSLEKQYDNEYELEYTFPHLPYIFLVNEKGIVERVYVRGHTVDVSRLVDDFETVVTG
ncbi:SCO family protein [Natrinema longum]|uniref:SCO family protein n=1 Tax=Natrinema longum TaxID=370324 RepID=A0A8A2U7K3_9EURY|nr:SCO family protein [Natrinema longum]MBZ6494031.1 SCO family protein [Natrinema longum]QSW84634.1 SCO family protein [Natrinema longum]